MNVVWAPTRVMVAVDTDCAPTPGLPNLLGPGTRGPVCKMVTLPAFGAVLAARGPVSFLPTAVVGAMLGGAVEGGGFDGLLSRLPEIAKGAHASCVDTVKDVGGRVDLVANYELAAAGWSESRGRMVAVIHWHYSDEEGPQVFELDQDWPSALAPRFDHEWEHDPPRNSAAMFALAKQQVDEARTKGPAGTGGNLIIATLTRESVTVVDHGDLSAPRSLLV